MHLPRTSLFLGVIAALTLAIAPTAASAAKPLPGVNAETPCVSAQGTPERVKHVIVLFMENQPFVEVFHSPEAPYINGLAERCGLAANYHNITHPSAPEYVAATSGLPGGKGDCAPVFLDPSFPPICPDANNNIFFQLSQSGGTWKDYEESMKQNCFEGEDETDYDINHNPAAYYTDLGGPSETKNSLCDRFDVPLGSFEEGNLETDLASGKLANFTFIAPNLINDTHDSTIKTGDEYLSKLIPTILNSPDYENGSTVLFITWDEGEGGETDKCAFNTTDIGCHVMMVPVSPHTHPGTVSEELFNHYSLLKTSEELLGLEPLGHARERRVHSMIDAFNL